MNRGKTLSLGMGGGVEDDRDAAPICGLGIIVWERGAQGHQGNQGL